MHLPVVFGAAVQEPLPACDMKLPVPVCTAQSTDFASDLNVCATPEAFDTDDTDFTDDTDDTDTTDADDSEAKDLDISDSTDEITTGSVTLSLSNLPSAAAAPTAREVSLASSQGEWPGSHSQATPVSPEAAIAVLPQLILLALGNHASDKPEGISVFLGFPIGA